MITQRLAACLQVNLYHFNYEHILPQTAPEKGVELNSIKMESGTSILEPWLHHPKFLELKDIAIGTSGPRDTFFAPICRSNVCPQYVLKHAKIYMQHVDSHPAGANNDMGRWTWCRSPKTSSEVRPSKIRKCRAKSDIANYLHNVHIQMTDSPTH